MGTKLIGLYVPAVQERFDLFVPTDLEISALTELLAQGVCELCKGRYLMSHQEMLTMREPDMLLHPQRTLGDYGVCDGAQLILF